MLRRRSSSGLGLRSIRHWDLTHGRGLNRVADFNQCDGMVAVRPKVRSGFFVVIQNGLETRDAR